MPVFYYPPTEDTVYDHIKSIQEPSKLWLTEMLRKQYGNTTYLEIQFWHKNQDGNMQIVGKCETHAGLIKMSGQVADEKSVSLEEVKWTRETMVFGVNFNCTRTCFKSELYIFARVRNGNTFLESQFAELPFRRSEKRKHDRCSDPSKKKQSKMAKLPTVIPDASAAAITFDLRKFQPKIIKTEEPQIKLEEPEIPEPTVPLEKVVISDVPSEILLPIDTQTCSLSTYNEFLSLDLWNP
eukprot:TRINITY_DN2719_c0_g1_i1.p1 TRINITY_DN2719_c0_g1~~TRINITY_DN2719_c0_g1_i1.p1  ORF type:complete len:239 (+),score=51.13 TRINITY_DN2719_c0_g1_i1:551-1267(+)